MSDIQLTLYTPAKYFTWFDSPIGKLLLAGSDNALHKICFPQGRRPESPDDYWTCRPEAFTEVSHQLDRYFRGKTTEFDIPLAPEGTDFQIEVWQALQKIPYGQTCSYAAVAEQIGRPNATRAVGNANGRNPIPIIIPCHRVIGRDGSLTGFGGGLPTKKFLLQLEDSDQLTLPL